MARLRRYGCAGLASRLGCGGLPIMIILAAYTCASAAAAAAAAPPSAASSLPQLFMDIGSDIVDPWGLLESKPTALVANQSMGRPPANYTQGATVIAAFSVLGVPGEYEVFVAEGRPGEPLSLLLLRSPRPRPEFPSPLLPMLARFLPVLALLPLLPGSRLFLVCTGCRGARQQPRQRNSKFPASRLLSSTRIVQTVLVQFSRPPEDPSTILL